MISGFVFSFFLFFFFFLIIIKDRREKISLQSVSLGILIILKINRFSLFL